MKSFKLLSKIINICSAIFLSGMVLLLDFFVIVDIIEHNKIPTAMMFSTLIFNLMLLTAVIFYLMLRYRGAEWDNFANTFFEVSKEKKQFTISTAGELLGYITLAMTCGTIIKSQAHKINDSSGLVIAASASYAIYFIGCLFISVALLKLAIMMRNTSEIKYFTVMIIASFVSYYLFGVGFDLG